MMMSIAMRASGDPISSNNGLFFVYSDHLGSASIMLRSNGDFVSGSSARHFPFGAYRTTPTQTISDRQFTGHAHNDDLGLIYMNARFYVGSIGRFASADTIVPDGKDPQAYNRYSYVRNNPLVYVDPTGHYFQPACPWCDVKIDISNWSSLSVNVASASCLVIGCHVNRDEGVLTGPTVQEQLESDLLSLAGPMGTVANPVVRTGKNIFQKTLGEGFERAAEFGIQTFKQLGKELGVGSGLQRHHIIEQRFSRLLGTNSDDMLSVALTREEHQRFTNQWRVFIGYNTDNKVLRTQNATRDDIWAAAREIYKDYPELLEAARRTLVGD